MPSVPDTVTTNGYKLAALAARMAPGVIAHGLAGPLGFGANFANPERRDMIERHLRRVDPSLRGMRLRRASQQAFDFYARYWIESFRLPSLSTRTVERGFTVDGYHQISAALEDRRGAIIALPHLGGWEWAGRWIADQGHEITVVVERIDPPELFEWFVDLRSKLGMHVVALGPKAGSTVVSALRNNHIVCLLSDRDIQQSGAPVEFFGETTTLPGGAATISLRTGAPIFPVAVYFTGRSDGHFAWVREPLSVDRRERHLRDDVTRIMQDLARDFEVLIRRAPSQWHLFQPNWPSDPGYDVPDSTRTRNMPTS
jgi:phosphatidylinositol dimannoside acyltransferase